MQLWRYSGLLLIGTGVIHNMIGIILGWDFLAVMASEGLWNTAEQSVLPGMLHTRAELLWFLMLGFAWIMIGALLHGHIRSQQTPPAKLYGWALFMKGIVIAILLPASGAWLFLPQGLILMTARIDKERG